MAKYIDADRLCAEIERLKGQLIRGACAAQIEMETNCKDEAYNEVLTLIDSLQQEQPCDTCTNDKGCVTCKDGELWEGKDQPSEDLKGEIREWVNLMVGASFPEQDGDYISEEDYRSVIRQTARHFYELGKNSK